MALLLIDGADDGLSAYKWTSGGTRDAAQFRTGTASLLVGGGTSGSTYPSYTLAASERHSTMIAGFAFRMASTVEAVGPLTFGGVGGITHIEIRRTLTGGFQVYRGATLIASSATGLYVSATWYHLEAKVFIDDTVGSVEVRLNGVQIINFFGDTRNAGADALIYTVFLSAGSGAPDRLMNVDDVFICNGAGSVNNDFLGDCTVQTLYPDGNGNYSQGTGSDGNSTDNYLLVDEANVPNTSDYVAFATTGLKDSYTFSDLGAGTVYGVAQRAYAAKSEAGARTMRNFTRIGATDYPSAVDQGLSVTPTYTGKSDIMQVSPASGSLWTVAEVNAAQFGVEARP
jgi:hypothetical protein